MTNVQQPGGPLEDRTTPAGAAAPGTSIPPTTIPTTPTSTRPAHAGGVGGTQSTTDTAKEEAAHLGESAKDAGRRVADTAKEEARNVASEAKFQGKRLLDQTMHEASEQAKTQQSRAAEGMHTFGGALREMASSSQQSDMASRLVGEIGDRVDAAGRWLEQRDPADLLDEVKSFARRNPGAFIGVAGVAGLVVGRLTRGMISQAKEEHERERGTAAVGSYDTYGTRAYGGTQPYAGTPSYGSEHTVEGFNRPSDTLGEYDRPVGSLDDYDRPAGSLADEDVDPVTGLPTTRRETGL
jgi:hypothetical protein